MKTTESPLPHAARLIKQGIADGLHLGAQLYVSLDGAVVADAAFGESEPGVALTPDMRFVFLSAGKPITAIAIAQQVEQGRIDLDTPVAYYIPEFAQRGKEAITTRHLLTHTGGFRAAVFDIPNDDWGTLIHKICLARLEPGWVPGEKAGYHPHTSWFILGELIRRITGQDIGEYLREYIFDPAGMDHCALGPRKDLQRSMNGAAAPMVTMWNTRRQPIAAYPWTDEAHLTQKRPGSNIHGPMRELGRFYEMLLAGGEYHGRRIVQPDTVATFTSRQREGMYDLTFKRIVDTGFGFIIDSKRHGGGPVPYGYGPYASDVTFGHSGMQSSVAFADPQHNLVVALAFNGLPGDTAHQQRIETALAALYEDLSLGEKS